MEAITISPAPGASVGELSINSANQDVMPNQDVLEHQELVTRFIRGNDKDKNAVLSEIGNELIQRRNESTTTRYRLLEEVYISLYARYIIGKVPTGDNVEVVKSLRAEYIRRPLGTDYTTAKIREIFLAKSVGVYFHSNEDEKDRIKQSAKKGSTADIQDKINEEINKISDHEKAGGGIAKLLLGVFATGLLGSFDLNAPATNVGVNAVSSLLSEAYKGGNSTSLSFSNKDSRWPLFEVAMTAAFILLVSAAYQGVQMRNANREVENLKIQHEDVIHDYLGNTPAALSGLDFAENIGIVIE